jgi:hypothetical protein
MITWWQGVTSTLFHIAETQSVEHQPLPMAPTHNALKGCSPVNTFPGRVCTFPDQIVLLWGGDHAFGKRGRAGYGPTLW